MLNITLSIEGKVVKRIEKKKKATQRKKQEKTVIFGFMQLTF